MEYKSFGRSGVKTSRLCFGAMLLSTNGYGPWRMPAVADESTCIAMLDKYVAAGGNFIDTSNNYGDSEVIIGNWLKGQNTHVRRKLIICTKFTSPVNTIPSRAAHNYPNSSGASRKHIMDAIEDSLERLQTKYIDVYTVHYWDDETQLEDVIRTLQSLIQMGRIRYYGVSNYTPVQLQQLISMCQRHQWELPIFTQSQYSLLCRTSEWELIRLCETHGIGFLAWSPLAGGWLSNKSTNLENAQIKPPANSRMGFAEAVHFSSWDLSNMASNPKTWLVLRACIDIAAELKATVSQVAIRWILAQDIAGCIVGPRTLAHLEDNIAALKIKLTPKHLTMLNEASNTPPIYPYCAFSELTIKPAPASSAISSKAVSPVVSSLKDYPGLQELILLSTTFQPTPNRPPWMARLINQVIYEVGANINPHLGTISLRDDKSDSLLFRSLPSKFALVFGGFLTVEEPITTLRQILSHIQLSRTVRSFIQDAFELLDQLISQATKELNITSMYGNLNLFEWIRLGQSDIDLNARLNFQVSLPILFMNQLVLLMHLLECTNLTLEQLKRSCIFLSGFSIGTVTAYVVDISNSKEQLRHNALVGLRLCFWFGLRTSQDFQKWKLEQYQKQLDNLGTNLPSSIKTDDPTEVNYNTGSLQISGVPYQDVFEAINIFNSTNPFGYRFDVCVVSQFNRVTLSGFSNNLPRLVEYLQLKFPSCSLVSVGLDTPIHSARYFPDTVSKIVDDCARGQSQFEGSPSKNQWNQTMLISDCDGQPSVELTCNELISNILLRVCRWDLVSDYLARIIQSNASETSDSSESIVILDFGPGVRTNNLISNNAYLKDCVARKQIAVFTTNNLPHSILAAVGKIHQNIINEGNWIERSLCNYHDSMKNNIAIIGMACRFPDANSPDEYYYNLLHKKHSIRKIPRERWDHSRYYNTSPKSVYQTNAQHMGVIEEVDLFDPQFFNINMRDATHMDPQHRLTLEMCYLALENAGYVIGEGARMGMSEQRVGVFVGCTGTDSYRKNMEAYMDAYLGQCEARSMQAGRVSYFYKFCGPSLQIDQACATGLVCLHLAVQSILNGDCDAAVVSAVLASTDPVEYLALAAGGFFSTGPNGGCKAFVAEADGYTRSDGVAAVVIKPYKAALKDRDCIHALINSTTANQSGQSQNLLLPSEPQIESLLQTVLRKAHLSPNAIQYIEAHGTGTQAGDPIETNAIVKTLGINAYRSKENPLYVGSHKAFIGHTEAAAGLAGLIKTVMMMQHKTITPHMTYKEINPKIHLEEHVIIPQEPVPWVVPDSRMPRRAIVNSFGFSGVNSSCVVQETPTIAEENNDELIEPEHVITISGKHPDSVRGYIPRFIQYLMAFQSKLNGISDTSERTTAELKFLRDLAFTTTARRNHFPHRIAIVSSTVTGLIRKLTTVLASIPDQLERLQKTIGSEFANLLTPLNEELFLSKELENVTNKSASSSKSLPTRIVFVFGGQGSQYFGMCRELLESSNVWAATFRQCSELFAALHPTLLPNNMTLLELLQAAHQRESGRTSDDGKFLLEEEDFISTQVCQPLLFAVEYSLGKMLMSWGIQPNYIIGHSFGELVGACLSSVMNLEDALFLIGHRARLMNKTSKGAMLALNCTVDEFRDLCRVLHLNENGRIEVSVAAHNGSRSIVAAGEPTAIETLQSHIANGKLFPCKKLNVTRAFHTNLMTPILDEFHSIAEKIIYKKSKIPILDTLNGELRTTFNADYWTQQLQNTVQFHVAVSSLCSLGIKENFQPICIELSPTPILSQYLTETDKNLQTYAVMRRNRSDFKQIYSVLAELYVRQLSTVCWSELHCANRHARVLSLPNYAYNHKSCWLKLPWVSETSSKENTTTPSVEVTPTNSSQSPSSKGSTEVLGEVPLIGKCRIVKDEMSGGIECVFPVFDRPWAVDIQNHIVSSNKLLSIPLYTVLVSQFAAHVIQRGGTNIDSNTFVNIKDLMVQSPFIWENTDAKRESCREISISLVPSKKNVPKESISTMFSFSVTSRKHANNQNDKKSKPVAHTSGTIYFSTSGIDETATNKASFGRTMSALENDSQNASSSVSYTGEEFYKRSSELGTIYGPHYRSVEKSVITKDSLFQWTKQTIKASQPYHDPNHLTPVHTCWLDSFVQGPTLQISEIPDLNRPFVAMFVERLVCRAHVYHSSPNQTQSKFPTFYSESLIKVNNPNLITCDTRGFDENGKCVVQVLGGLMISAATGLNDKSPTQDSESTNKNKKNTSTKTKKSSTNKESNDKSHSVIQNIIIGVVSESLDVEPSSLDLNENFANLGIDSLLSIEIRGKLKNTFQDIDLSPTILFDHPSVNALTPFIASLKPTTGDNNDEDEKEVEEEEEEEEEDTSSSTIQRSESTNKNKKNTSTKTKKSSTNKESNDKSHSAIQNIIIGVVSESLDVEPSSLDLNENFANLGIDSLLSIEIRGKLKNTFQDIDLSPTILFDHPSVNALTPFIASLKPTTGDNNDEDEKEVEEEEEEEEEDTSSSTIQPNDTSSASNHEEISNENKRNKFDPDAPILPDQIRDRVTDLIAESLKISDISIQDNDRLTDIGVNPLLALEIRAKLQNVFNLNLSSSVIFDYPTVGQLSEYIQKEFICQSDKSNSIKEHENTSMNTNDSENKEDLSSENLAPAESFTTNTTVGSPITVNSSENRDPSMLSSVSTSNSKSESSPAENRPKLSTVKTIYSKITLPQITAQPDLLYEPFPMVNLCQAYTLGQYLPEMAVRSHILLVKSFKLDLDVDKLEAAWNQCIQRHPMLRCELNSEFHFQILKEVPYYTIKRFYATTESEQQEQVNQLKEWRLSIGVNNKWPMAELFIVCGPEKTLLVFDSDIVVVDFHSLLTVCDDLLHFYKNEQEKLSNKCSISYRDYIMHYKTLQETYPLAQEHKKYWMDRVSTIPGGIRFPRSFDHGSSALPARNPGFDSKCFRMDSSVWQQIQASIRARGLQVPTTVCALFASVLAVFCNCNHFTMNIVFVNRLPFHPDVERLIGNLSSALLLEFDYRDSNLTFYQHARRVYQRFLGDLANSSFFTASSLVPILNNRRESTLVPVSSVAFVSLLQFDDHFLSLNDEDFGFYFERNAPNTDYAVLETAAMELDHQIAVTADGSLSMAFDFVRNLLPDYLMDHFIKCYMDKLTSLINNETWESKAMLNQYNIHDIRAMPLVGLKSDIQQNGSKDDDNFRPTLLFNELVRLATDAETAHHTALISVKHDMQLSYQKVLFLALKLAGQLKTMMNANKNSSKSSNHIGVTCQRGWEQIISCLAITMIGGVFVPIDGDLPPEQYQTRLKLADVAVVCTTKVMLEQLRRRSPNSFYEHVQFVQVDVVLASHFQEVLQNSEVHFEEHMQEIYANNDPKNVAYIIFTSGTTGQPKPVCISHASAMNTIVDINARIKLNKEDRVIALANLSFDLSIWDIFGSFNAGSALVILDGGDDSASDPFYWLKAIQKYQITVWNSVPQLLYLLYHTIDHTQAEQRLAIRSMRQILLSGDWIPLELPHKFYSLWKSIQEKQGDQLPLQILSLGGATECSIWSNFHWIDCVSPPTSSSYAYAEWQSIPYGQSLSGQSLYILSSTLDYCPDYVTGQLFIGGAGLATEYYKSPDLTNRQFIIHPATQERLYATGDHARFRPFGSDRVIELLGRIEDDSQVKVQGYRVECAEIEWSLNQLEFVKQAVVIGTKNSSTTKRTDSEFGSGSTLVAYIVLDASYEATDKFNTAEFSILQHCEKSLPYYMVPHKILFVKEIPRSFNGKIDRQALLELYSEMSSTSPEHEDTRNTIANGWHINGNHLEHASKDSDSAYQNHDSSFDPSQSSSILAKLWSIWNRALNRSDQPVSQWAEHANTNLLALGATSLTLLMIRAMVQHEFSLTLPLKAFRKEPRLYQMAEMIKNEIRKRETDANHGNNNVNGYSARSTDTRMAHVICLNRAETPTAGPLIFFHPSTGGVEFYNQISQLMIERTGPRHSYAIQGFGLEADEAAESDFTKIIQTYFDTINSIEEVTTSSSFGALTLIGYSSGGILAYAVGHEFFLHNQGNLIESIILLDTPSPITSHYLSPVTDNYATEIVVKSLNVTDNNTDSLQTEVFSRLVAVTKANLVAIQTHFSKTNSSSLNLEQLESLMHKIIFVFAAETYAKKDGDDPSYGWKEYFRRIAKLIMKNAYTKSVESDDSKNICEDIVVKSLKKPIQSPGTHFQLLLPINLGNLVSQLHTRLSQNCNGN